MTTKRWLGGAEVRRWGARITPNGFGSGDILRLSVNRKTLEVAGDAEDGIVPTLVEMLQATNTPELRELEVISPINEEDDQTVLVLAGPEDGKPITLLTESVNADGFGVSVARAFPVTVTTITDGYAGQNEKVQITLASVTTGGTFTLSFGGYTTGAIAHNATAATVQTTFSALTSVGSGNCEVTGEAKNWVIEFVGTLARTNVGPVTGNGTNLVGGASITASTITEGLPITNCIQRIAGPTQYEANAGFYFAMQLQSPVDGTTMYRFVADWNTSADALQAQMYYLASGHFPYYSVRVFNRVEHLGTGGDGLPTVYYTWDVEFVGPLGGQRISQLQPDTALGSYVSGSAQILQEGGEAGRNEVQQIAVDLAQGGTWAITLDGQTTAALAYNATNVQVQAALAGLSNVGGDPVTSPNVVVTKTTASTANIYRLTFQGTLARTDISQVTTINNLTGGPVYATVVQESQPARNEVQRVTIPASAEIAAGMTFVLAMSTDATTPLAYNVSAASMQAALEALPGIGSGNVVVTGGGDTRSWTVTCQGSLAATDLALLSAYTPAILTITGGADGGTFALAYGGQTTAGIAVDASAATVQSRLAALSTIGTGNVLVTGNGGGPWTVFFQSSRATANPLGITGSTSLVTGPGTQTIGLEETQPTGSNWFTAADNWADGVLPAEGDALLFEAGETDCLYGLDPLLLIMISGNPDGGGWSMKYKGYGPPINAGLEDAVLTPDEIEPVPPDVQLPYNATADQVQTYLEAIPCLGSGSVLVTGADGGPWKVMFLGPATTFAGEILLTVDGTELLVNDVSGVASIAVAQTELRLASIRKRANYTGLIGLPDIADEYHEYRPQSLVAGASGSVLAIELGDGEGTGSSLVRLDTRAHKTALTIRGAGSQVSDILPAVTWIGTHADNAVTIYSGSFGSAVFSYETAVIKTLVMGYKETRESDAVVTLGDHVTLGTVTKHGGTLTVGGLSGSSTPISLTQVAGTTEINGTDGVASPQILGGTAWYSSTGTISGNAFVAGDGVLDFTRDLRTKTVTNPIVVDGDSARVIDSEHVVSGLVIDYQNTTRQPDYGRNFRVTRSA